MATQPRASQSQRAEKRDAPGDFAGFAQRIHDLGLEAVASVAGARVEETAQQWLAKTNLDPNDPTSPMRVMEAFALSSFLTLLSSSLLGVSPLERFVRQRRANADDLSRAALDALANTEFHLILLKARRTPDGLDVEDLATGKILSLFDSDIPASALSVRVAAWLAPLPNGEFLLLGPVTPLDPSALAEGLSFARPGKGLNARRCAAAVYKHVVRHGGLRVHGLNAFPEDAPDDDLDDHDEADGLDRLAFAIKGMRDAEVPADIIGEARQMAAPLPLIQALVRSVIARERGGKDLAAAFSHIGFLMMETLDRRASIGSGVGRTSLDAIAAEIDRDMADGRAPTQTRALFDVLRRRLAVSGKAGDKAGDAELARVLQLIQALRAKTIDQGCTEQEALASARKVAELLDRYGLSLSEVDMRDQACQSFGVDTGRKRRAPVDECMPVVGLFCDCKVWGETGKEGAIRFVFFGLPADVEAARYLHELIVATFETETARFKRAEVAKGADGRRVSAHSFQVGLAHGISDKLTGLKAERDAANRRATGRDLVPLKTSVIEDELEKLGLCFRAKSQNRKRKVAPGAYDAGRAAGRKFEPHRSVSET